MQQSTLNASDFDGESRTNRKNQSIKVTEFDKQFLEKSHCNATFNPLHKQLACTEKVAHILQ